MRRRRPTPPPSSDPDGLTPDAVPAFRDDAGQPYSVRRARFKEWLGLRADWIERREQFAELYGWPGGDLARITEENESHPVPDGPFDPDYEMKHGWL